MYLISFRGPIVGLHPILFLHPSPGGRLGGFHLSAAVTARPRTRVRTHQSGCFHVFWADSSERNRWRMVIPCNFLGATKQLSPLATSLHTPPAMHRGPHGFHMLASTYSPFFDHHRPSGCDSHGSPGLPRHRLRVPFRSSPGPGSIAPAVRSSSKSRWPKPAPIQGQGLHLLMGGVSKNLGTSFKSQYLHDISRPEAPGT